MGFVVGINKLFTDCLTFLALIETARIETDYKEKSSTLFLVKVNRSKKTL